MKTYKKGSFYFVELPEDVLEEYDEELDKVLKNTVALNKYGIVIDLKNTRYLSSFTLRILIKYHKAALSSGRSFSLLNLDAGLKKFLEAARLNSIFHVYASEDDLFRHTEDAEEPEAPAPEAGFTYDVADRGGIVVMRLSGLLEDVAQLKSFEEAVVNWVKEKKCRFIFNLERLNFIDSLCIGRFVKLNRFLITRGGKLVFCSASEMVRDFFNVLGLNHVLLILPDESAAAQELGQ
jgi:anti-anti-sigma factor